MPHTRSPPFRRRLQWPSFLSLLAFLSALYLPSVYAQAKSATDYFIHSLPGAPEPLLKMYAGHVEITPTHHGNLFFWLFKNKHLADRPRTVLWLNGGPGCSSMDGALMEIGPYRVNEDGTLRYLDGSWYEFANLLFVDNPVGTGFSYVDGDSYVHELDTMADQMVVFLERFFAMFPEHMHDDLYIAGESYAGQHIPYIAKAILDRNTGKSAHDQWNLNGLLIGNGWISGPEQYISYIPFLYEEGVLQRGSEAAQNAESQQRECLKVLNEGGADYIDVVQCELIMHGLNRDLLDSNTCVNVYDVRLTDSYPACGMTWPPDLKQITPYLRREDVLRALHINPEKKTGWQECTGQVSREFSARNSAPSINLLPDLLAQVPIVLFSGDKDLICNHIGTENIIDGLDWNGAIGMQNAPAQAWSVDGEDAGTWQSARNLTYIRFFDSSHMVPFDVPRRTRNMLDRFMGVDSEGMGLNPISSHVDGEADFQPSPPPTPSRPTTPIDDGSKEQDLPAPPTTSAEKAALEAATWAAYQRSGEAALVVVLIAAAGWGFFVYRDRRRRRQGYLGVFSSDPYDDDGRSGAASARRERQRRDIESARAFDESELDDLGRKNGDEAQFGLADDEDEDVHPGMNGGRANGGLGIKAH